MLRIHLLELEKVNELCKDFCQRYITCLRVKLSTDSLFKNGIDSLSDDNDDSFNNTNDEINNNNNDDDSSANNENTLNNNSKMQNASVSQHFRDHGRFYFWIFSKFLYHLDNWQRIDSR